MQAALSALKGRGTFKLNISRQLRCGGGKQDRQGQIGRHNYGLLCLFCNKQQSVTHIKQLKTKKFYTPTNNKNSIILQLINLNFKNN